MTAPPSDREDLVRLMTRRIADTLGCPAFADCEPDRCACRRATLSALDVLEAAGCVVMPKHIDHLDKPIRTAAEFDTMIASSPYRPEERDA